MLIGSCEVKIHIPFSNSLKDKRIVAKSLIAKLGNKFNISVAETDMQDDIRMLCIGFANVSNTRRQCDAVTDRVLGFIDENCEGEVIDIQREVL